MRESKLLLIKNIAPEPPKKTNHLNMLSNLVEYNSAHGKLKTAVIPTNNISLSPTKLKRTEKKLSVEKNITSHYTNAAELQRADFVKMFIIEELLYYISKTVQLWPFRTNASRRKWRVSANSTTKIRMRIPTISYRTCWCGAETT